MSIVERLTKGMEQEHGEILELAERLKRAEATRQRPEMLSFLHQMFELHAATEEEALYSALDRNEAMKELSASLQSEHLCIEEQFILLGSLSDEAEQWTRGLQDLITLMRSHFTRETRELGPALEKLDEFSMHWADRRYRQVKDSVGIRTA